MAIERAGEQQYFYVPGALETYPEQAYLMETIQPVHYLCAETQCLLCPRRADKDNKVYLTLEHVIPKLACETYAESLGPIKNVDENHITLCRNCHDIADFGVKKKPGSRRVGGKMETFHSKGIPGLISYISDYARTPHSHYRDRQYRQWSELFGTLETQLPIEVEVCQEEILELKDRSFGVIPGEQYMAQLAALQSRIRAFDRACQIVSTSLNKWGQGDFFAQSKSA